MRILGLRRLLVMTGYGQIGADIVQDVPPELADAGRAVSLTSRHRNAVIVELLLLSRVHGPPPDLGDLPLTVLTAAGRDRTWMSMQSELASLSMSGTHIVADHGVHHLQRDNPAFVKSAILDLYRGLEPDTQELRKQ